MFYYKEKDRSKYSFHLQLSSKKYHEKFNENVGRTLRRKWLIIKLNWRGCHLGANTTVFKIASIYYFPIIVDTVRKCISKCDEWKKNKKKKTTKNCSWTMSSVLLKKNVGKYWYWLRWTILEKRKDDPNQLMAIDQEMSTRRS